MRFRLIDAAKKEFPVQRLCKVLGVSQSGYFARKDRPACRRQHEDMVLLAHIRSAFALSNATYGSPRMTRELRDDGITIGRHRVARLMRENALKARQRRRFKRTTDSLHAFPVAPNLLNQDFNATVRIPRMLSTRSAGFVRRNAHGVWAMLKSGHEQPVPIFQQLAGSDPSGGDDVRAVPAVAA